MGRSAVSTYLVLVVHSPEPGTAATRGSTDEIRPGRIGERPARGAWDSSLAAVVVDTRDEGPESTAVQVLRVGEILSVGAQGTPRPRQRDRRTWPAPAPAGFRGPVGATLHE